MAPAIAYPTCRATRGEPRAVLPSCAPAEAQFVDDEFGTLQAPMTINANTLACAGVSGPGSAEPQLVFNLVEGVVDGTFQGIETTALSCGTFTANVDFGYSLIMSGCTDETVVMSGNIISNNIPILAGWSIDATNAVLDDLGICQASDGTTCD